MTVDRRADLLRVEKQMRAVRWLVVPFTIIQFTLYRAPPGTEIPFNMLVAGAATTGAVLLINGLSLVSQRVESTRRLQWIGRIETVADSAMALGVVAVFSFDPQSALWALLILPVLEGAIRGRLRGAITTWALCAMGYLARELIAPLVFPQAQFEIESFTYRMGIVFVVAAATGYLAENLESRIVDHQNARRESEHRAELLRTVAKAGRKMSTLDADRVLGVVADAAVELGFEAVSIAMIDEPSGMYTHAEARGLPNEVTLGASDVAEGIVGIAFREHRTVWIDEYSEWKEGLPEVRSLGFRAVIASPIPTGEQIESILVAGTRARSTISDYEIECVDLLAAHAGAALSTVHHFSERQALQAQLRRESFHDALTELPNRTLFLERLRHCLERKAATGSPTAVLFVDLDRFKKVNESLGHTAGDDLLRQVAVRLRGLRTPGDTVARYGGDDFAILIEEPRSQRAVMDIASQVVNDLQQPFTVRGQDIYISASVGVSFGHESDSEARDFVREADIAMYRAKELGGGRAEAYRPVMTTQAKRRMELELELRRAIRQDELVVHYQPAIAIATGQVVGLEALVRWKHPRRGLLRAGEFIPFAEETGLIVPIGQRILDEVAAQISVWRANPAMPELTVGVNLSATELAEPDFVDRLTSVLDAHKLRPADIIFEVTESVVVRDDDRTRAQMRKLSRTGVRIAIDDFGLGYSSLGYLKRFRFAVLKIDRSFVTELTTTEADQAIVRHILGLAKDLNIPVVVEGVETADQLEYLRSTDCEYVQGFYVCKPLDWRKIERFVTQHLIPVEPDEEDPAPARGREGFSGRGREDASL